MTDLTEQGTNTHHSPDPLPVTPPAITQKNYVQVDTLGFNTKFVLIYINSKNVSIPIKT